MINHTVTGWSIGINTIFQSIIFYLKENKKI